MPSVNVTLSVPAPDGRRVLAIRIDKCDPVWDLVNSEAAAIAQIVDFLRHHQMTPTHLEEVAGLQARDIVNAWEQARKTARKTARKWRHRRRSRARARTRASCAKK